MKKPKEDRGLRIPMIALMVMAQQGNGHIYVNTYIFGNGCIYNECWRKKSKKKNSNKLASLEATIFGDYDRPT